LKIVPFESLGTVSYSHSIATGCIFSRFWDIQRRLMVWPWILGQESFKLKVAPVEISVTINQTQK